MENLNIAILSTFCFISIFANASDYQCMSISKTPKPAKFTYVDGGRIRWQSIDEFGNTSMGKFTGISQSSTRGIVGERIYKLMSTRNNMGEYMFLSIPQRVVLNPPQIIVSLFQECHAEICDDPSLIKQFDCKLLPAKY